MLYYDLYRGMHLNRRLTCESSLKLKALNVAEGKKYAVAVSENEDIEFKTLLYKVAIKSI